MRPEILLKCFVEHRSEDAFRDLVSGALPLVYSTTLRICDHSVPLAQAATERVFLKLARHATLLNGSTAIGPWLHRAACEAANAVLREADREPQSRARARLGSAGDLTTRNIEAIGTVLDKAINSLSVEARITILGAMFEKSGVESRPLLATTPVEKLRRGLRRLGVRIEGSIMGEVLGCDWIYEPTPGLKMRAAEGALLGAARSASFLERIKPIWLRPAHGFVLIGIAAMAALAAVWPAHKPPQPSTAPSETKMTPMQWVDLGMREDEPAQADAQKTGKTTPQAFGTQHETEPSP
jgi:hypothetical protein